MSGVMVSQVDQAQGRLIGIVGLIQLCAQLRDHQAGGHGPLGMRGMAVGKQLHFFGLERLRVGFEGAAAGAVAATASALRCMSFMASPAICWNCWVSEPHHAIGSMPEADASPEDLGREVEAAA